MEVGVEVGLTGAEPAWNHAIILRNQCGSTVEIEAPRFHSVMGALTLRTTPDTHRSGEPSPAAAP